MTHLVCGIISRLHLSTLSHHARLLHDLHLPTGLKPIQQHYHHHRYQPCHHYQFLSPFPWTASSSGGIKKLHWRWYRGQHNKWRHFRKGLAADPYLPVFTYCLLDIDFSVLPGGAIRQLFSSGGNDPWLGCTLSSPGITLAFFDCYFGVGIIPFVMPFGGACKPLACFFPRRTWESGVSNWIDCPNWADLGRHRACFLVVLASFALIRVGWLASSVYDTDKITHGSRQSTREKERDGLLSSRVENKACARHCFSVVRIPHLCSVLFRTGNMVRQILFCRQCSSNF